MNCDGMNSILFWGFTFNWPTRKTGGRKIRAKNVEGVAAKQTFLIQPQIN